MDFSQKNILGFHVNMAVVSLCDVQQCVMLVFNRIISLQKENFKVVAYGTIYTS